MEAAAFSIDIHNAGGAWNKALIDNAARPSGALIFTGAGGADRLSDEQFQRLKSEMEDMHVGAANSGRPMLLDAWGPGEPPLGFPTESYQLDILDGGVSIRRETIAVPSFLYSAAAQTADFGSLPGSLHIRVAQWGESGATGLNAELTITL